MRTAKLVTLPGGNGFRVVYFLDLWERYEDYKSLDTAMIALRYFMETAKTMTEAAAYAELPGEFDNKDD